MRRNMLFRNIILSASLIATSVSYGQSQDATSCPSVTTIQQASYKMDRTQPVEGSSGVLYYVYSSTPAFFENGKAWYIGINYVLAHNPNEAVTEAQKIIQKTISQTTPTTQPFNYCLYNAKRKPEDAPNMIWASLTSPFINS